MIRLPKLDQTLSEDGKREHTQKATSKQGETRGNVASKAGQVTSGSDCLSFHFNCGACAQPILCFPMDIMFIWYFFVIHFRSCIHISEKAWLCGSQKGWSLLPTQVEDQECLSPILMLVEGFASASASGNFTSSSTSSTFIETSGRREEKRVSLRYWKKASHMEA